MAQEPRINIDVTADNLGDAELAARLVAAAFNQNGFEDVTNLSNPTHLDRDEEVVAAMQNLSPSIFQAEVVIEADVFKIDSAAIPGTADEDLPGDNFPDPNNGSEDDDEDVPSYDVD